MKKIYWSLIIIGIIGCIISIFLAGEHLLVMVGFFGIYLLATFAIFTYLFDSIKVKRELPELLNRKNMIVQ